MGFLVFYLYVFILLVRPQEWWEPLHELPLVNIFLLLSALSVAFYRNKNLAYPQFYLAGLFIIQVVFSSIVNGWAGGGVIKAEKLLADLFLPILCSAVLIDNEARREKIFKLMIFSALFMVFNGITQVNSEDGYGFVGSKVTKYDQRITYIGILNDPNDLGMYLVMVLPMIAYFVIRSPGFWRYVYFFYATIILYGVYLTNSRGTLLGVIALFGLWHLFSQGVNKTLWRGALILPLILLIMTMFRTIDAGEESAAGRIQAWYEGVHLFLENPFFGVGQGDFTEYNELTAHNSYVLVFSELGFPGYFLWVAMLYLTLIPLWKLFQYFSQEKTNFDQYVTDNNEIMLKRNVAIDHGRLLFYSMIGYVVTAFFLSRSYSPLLYLFIGICISSIENIIREDGILKIEKLRDNLIAIFSISLCSIICIWILIKLFI
jgi:putative inorganic carbon (HCO3(-)) transporter